MPTEDSETKEGEDNLDVLPNIRQIDAVIEKALKELFQENYPTGVIKYRTGLYLVLPPEFFHFPPAIVSCESHPDRPDKILYVIISLRIPIPCNTITDALLSLKNVILFDVEKAELLSTGTPLCYINIGNRIHSLSIINDTEWFLMMFSSILKSPLSLYRKLRSETTAEFPSKLEVSTKESEETSIW